MRWIWITLLGLALGTSAALTDAHAGGFHQTGLWRALSMLLNAGCVWAALAVVCGWLLVTPSRAAIGGLAGLMLAVGGYYLAGVTLGDRTAIGLRGVSGALGSWLGVAVVAGPVLGLVGSVSRRRDDFGVAAGLVVPIVTVLEMMWRGSLNGSILRIDPWLGWADVGLIAGAIVWATLVVLKWFGRRGVGASDRRYGDLLG